MKQLLFVLMAIIGSLGAKSQKDFEGKVVYLLEADKDEKKPELTVWFAPGKLKIGFKENEETEATYTLVRLDSGKVFTINTGTQHYKARKLKTSEGNTFVAEKKNIAGHSTTALLSESSSPGNGLGGIFSMNDITFDLADDLTYTVPSQYKGNAELMMVHQNRIALGASMKMSVSLGGMEEDEEETKGKNITARAISVTPMSLAASEFDIPAGYTPQPKYDREAADSVAYPAYDTAMAVVADSAVKRYSATKRVGKKSTKKPTNKKTAPKSAAYRKQ
jgi:hypothetical protein